MKHSFSPLLFRENQMCGAVDVSCMQKWAGGLLCKKGRAVLFSVLLACNWVRWCLSVRACSVVLFGFCLAGFVGFGSLCLGSFRESVFPSGALVPAKRKLFRENPVCLPLQRGSWPCKKGLFRGSRGARKTMPQEGLFGSQKGALSRKPRFRKSPFCGPTA